VSEPQDAAPNGEIALSEREAAVLEAVARGLSNREIGRQLWISEQTVKFHLRNVYRKLGISSRTEAARYAHRMGIVAALTVETA
jgi:DNA-binding NarL/FixJ family response regulator